MGLDKHRFKLGFCWEYAQFWALSFFPRSIPQYWFKMYHFYQYFCQKINLVKYLLKAGDGTGMKQINVKDSNEY